MPGPKSRKRPSGQPTTGKRNSTAPWMKVGTRGPAPRIVTPLEMRLLGSELRTLEEAAAALNMSRSTLQIKLREHPPLREAWETGKHETHALLRKRQLNVALDPGHPNAAMMLIHLGKALLGQSEKTQHEHFGNVKVSEIRRVIIRAGNPGGDDIAALEHAGGTIAAPHTIDGSANSVSYDTESGEDDSLAEAG